MIGRRRTDVAAARAGAPTRHVLRGRLGAVSVTGALAAGAWVGFGLGLVLGAVLGALLCWFADAALQWQRDLGFTLGVAQNLLPLGDQTAALRTISRLWYVVIPVAALVVGVIWAALAALVAALVAATYNRAARHALVLVELSEPEVVALEASLAEARAEGLAVERPGEIPEDERLPGEPAAERRLSVVVASPEPEEVKASGDEPAHEAEMPSAEAKPANGKRRRAS